MLSYIFLVALFNVCLGFGVGVYLGHRYRLAAAAGALWGGDAMLAQALGTAVGSGRQASGATAGQIAPPGSAFARGGQDSGAEKLIEEWKASVDQYRGQLTQTDNQLRIAVEDPDAEAVRECLDSLTDATERYLEDSQREQDGFRELCSQDSKMGGICEDLQTAVRQQEAQIKNATGMLEAFDYEGDLSEGCRQMIGQTSKLMDVNHHLRDTLDKATVAVARNEQRLGSDERYRETDSLTGLLTRAGVEVEFFEWWEDDPARQRQLSVALIDVDAFAQVNERFGHKVGNKIIRAIAQDLQSGKRDDCTIARFSGQRFLFLFTDSDTRSATNAIERVRQVIASTRFGLDGTMIQLSVSCAVTEASAEDTSETLLERVETTLLEAKRYGRNRTFLHEGTYPTPVVPPNFSVEPNRIDL